ncbi:hypothetical protein HBI56_187490 [Parastagonospora nodorum]|nr:hypothetical protein HBI95_200250 [Parastagonospora nodorum]KAH4863934.1 hypothetical protein HBH75_002240 [Parastagonospora nodorum]KAH4927329.1 hypothetical protein HBI79_136170 [Parastagonospora nodorum]KAH5014040.1 hypothetical protein HBI74_182860 [Parastagonospora nodorum]KAH5016344.1 hypothetical protein HBI75_183560 [Parastagonospora nodorum]
MSDQTTPFLAGWTKLPDELKLEVLRNALPRDMEFNSIWTRPQALQDVCLLEHCIPYLACPPLAALALEVIYSQNTLRLTIFRELNPALPPVHYRNFVRYWHVLIEVNHVPFGSLDKLAAAFPNVQSVRVHIHPYYQAIFEKPVFSKAILRELENMSVVHFPAKSLHITYHAARMPGFSHGRSVELDEFQDPTLSKLSIVGGGEQWCRRRILEWDDEKRRNVEVEVPNANPGNDYIFTTKDMRR